MSELSEHLYATAVAFSVAAGVGCGGLVALTGNPHWWLSGLLAAIGTLPVHLVIARDARAR